MFNLGAGRRDVRNGQSLDVAQLIRDYFIVFPSLHPFSARDSRARRRRQSDERRDLHDAGRVSLFAAASGVDLSAAVRYQTAGTDERRRDHARRDADASGLGARVLDGRPLVRDLDYRIDYDLGRIEFLRPDTLFALPRHVDVSYEENPVFARDADDARRIRLRAAGARTARSTSRAINQSQSTPFTRPQLGFQGYSTLTAGVTAQFNWDAPVLTRLREPVAVRRIEGGVAFLAAGRDREQPSAIRRAQSGPGVRRDVRRDDGGRLDLARRHRAGTTAACPRTATRCAARVRSRRSFEPNRAATLVWQTNVQTPTADATQFTRSRSIRSPSSRERASSRTRRCCGSRCCRSDQGGRRPRRSSSTGRCRTR